MAELLQHAFLHQPGAEFAAVLAPVDGFAGSDPPEELLRWIRRGRRGMRSVLLASAGPYMIADASETKRNESGVSTHWVVYAGRFLPLSLARNKRLIGFLNDLERRAAVLRKRCDSQSDRYVHRLAQIDRRRLETDALRLSI